jgi:hypothetical protein
MQASGGSPEDLVAEVLTPSRSGLILGRSDLVRMARELGTGARVGNRRFVLSGLLRQEGERALEWLSQEASRQALLHGSLPASLQPIREFWQRRAEGSGAALARLLGEADPP